MTDLPSEPSVDPGLRGYLDAELERAERDFPFVPRPAHRPASRRIPARIALAVVAIAVAVVIGPRLLPAVSVSPGSIQMSPSAAVAESDHRVLPDPTSGDTVDGFTLGDLMACSGPVGPVSSAALDGGCSGNPRRAVAALDARDPGHAAVVSTTSWTDATHPGVSVFVFRLADGSFRATGVACQEALGSCVGIGSYVEPLGASIPPAGPGGSVAPTPLPAGPDVEAGGMVDALNGWAVTNGRLWVTADGGATWRDATPPGGFATASAGNLLGVSFADAQHGWLAVNEAFTSTSDPTYGRVDIWRTTDGGATWAKTQLPKARFAAFGEIMPAVQFDFLDVTHGFAFQSGNLAKGRNDSDLFWTADGGQSWSADRATGPGNLGIEGSVAFATANDGVVLNGAYGVGIVVTRDGGRSWANAALALPAESAAAQLFFTQPVFFDGVTGLVAIDVQSDTSSVTRVFGTADAGSSWALVATPPAGSGAISFLDPQRWIAVSGAEVARTVDGGQTWTHSPAAGLPAGPTWFRMTDTQHGSALVGMSVCLTFKSNCSSRTDLYATADGGSTWTQLWPG